ncbi:MAG: PilZ domain-containing protein [Candidatus Omnitrophica bacterium]|nr:PilZ domain-containing protein [Candidatus Omnitrophota bacterium]
MNKISTKMGKSASERRTAPRTGISFPVECNFLPRRNYFYTVSRNLSDTGAKITTSDFIPKGNYVKVHINLIDRVVDLKAKVAWCSKERSSERYSAGLEFVELNKTNKNALAGLLKTITQQ